MGGILTSLGGRRHSAGGTRRGHDAECLWAAWRLIAKMLAEGRRGDVVVIMGDAGRAPDLDGSAYTAAIDRFLATGDLDVPQ